MARKEEREGEEHGGDDEDVRVHGIGRRSGDQADDSQSNAACNSEQNIQAEDAHDEPVNVMLARQLPLGDEHFSVLIGDARTAYEVAVLGDVLADWITASRARHGPTYHFVFGTTRARLQKGCQPSVRSKARRVSCS